MNFKDKYVLITGASSGIGEALALHLAKEKAKLILVSRNVESLNNLKEECLKYTSECEYFQINLADKNDVNKKMEQIVKRYPKIYLLINNAGISQRSLAIETPLEVDRQIMEVNFFGSVEITKAVVPLMLRNGGGQIAIVSSVTGKYGFPLRSAYAASKHAMQGFFESMRAELYDKNIFITIFSPGRIYTNISINAITKDGEKYGIMDNGQAKGMPVNKCAGIMIRAIKRKKKESVIGGKEKYLVYVRKFFPSLFYRIASHVNPV